LVFYSLACDHEGANTRKCNGFVFVQCTSLDDDQSHYYHYFIQINEESIESVLNGSRARKNTSYFLILVDYRQHLETCSRGPSLIYSSEHAKAKLMSAITRRHLSTLQLKGIFLDVFFDRNGWYGYDCVWQGPLYVFDRFSDSAQSMRRSRSPPLLDSM
jgi:hypothetical protein